MTRFVAANRRAFVQAASTALWAWCSGCATTGDSSSILWDRRDSAPRRRLEPMNGMTLHGAGQAPEEFRRYYDAMADGAKPLIYMAYVPLRGDIAGCFDRLRTQIDAYETYLVPQIGLSMTVDGEPRQHFEHEVAAGRHDDRIDAYCQGLKSLRRPAFLRIGFEFNGRWNGYEPAPYRAAFRRIAAALRRHELAEVATVWCHSPDGSEDLAPFYPGDEAVDWWSIDLFAAQHIGARRAESFLTDAARRGFPVMIGESAPRGLGVRGGAATWDAWFAPLLDLVKRHQQIKALCYISRDWAAFPQWRSWGNSQITADATILDHWRDRLGAAGFAHASSAPKVRAALGLDGG